MAVLDQDNPYWAAGRVREVDTHNTGIYSFSNQIYCRSSDWLVDGELGGAHGINGKGATAYQEQNNVPFIVAHPDVAGGQRCKAVTSHLDIAPTLISMAGGSPDTESTVRGKDISPVLRDPASASYDAIRPAAIYNYNMLAYLDRDFMLTISKFLREGGDPADLPNQGWRPNMEKRGAIRSVFDGQYKFSRYFSPQQHHLPQSIEDIYANNDVELFDLKNDPNEMVNLATNRQKNGDLLLAMNQKLNALIEYEVGEDIGQMMPGGPDANWSLDPSISSLRM